MVIWLEDLLDEQDDAQAVSEGEPMSERQSTPAPTPEREPRDDAEHQPAPAATGDAAPNEDATAETADQAHDPAASEAAIADDDGWSLMDIEAARFTRH